MVRRYTVQDIGRLPGDLNVYHSEGEVSPRMNSEPVRLPALRMAGPVIPALLLLLLLSATGSLAQTPAPAPADPCTAGPELYRSAQFGAARVALEKCLAANGPSIEALLPLLVMSVQEARLTEAVGYGAQAVALAPDNAEAHYWYGRALLRSQRQADAKAQWEAGLQVATDHMGLLEGMARMALAEKEDAKAYQLLSRMRQLGNSDSWISRLMADIAAGKGMWSQSLSHLEDAMAHEDTTAARDLLTASELSIMAGDKPRAVEFCRRAVDLEPGAATYGGLGQAYFAVEEIDSALVYLRLAVEQDPETSHYRFNLANALEIDGQIEEADAQFRAFLAQEPDDSVGYFNYAIHLNKMGRPAEGLAAVDKAIDLDPGMLTARVVRIQLLEGMARWDEALEELAELRARSQDSRAPSDQDSLDAWEARLIHGRDQAAGNINAGKVHLQHLVVGTAEAAAQVEAELAKGTDFSALVVRFSAGPTAVRGGDIGWLDPADMVAPLRDGINALSTNEISPPIESKGLYHFFKRLP